MRWLEQDSIRLLWHHCRHQLLRFFFPRQLLFRQYRHFLELLAADNQALDLVSEIDDHLFGVNPADPQRISLLCRQAQRAIGTMASHLVEMNPGSYHKLASRLHTICQQVDHLLPQHPLPAQPPYILSLDQAAEHPQLVGGKAANLAIAGATGAAIPRGFVITTSAFSLFLEHNDLTDRYCQLLQQLHSRDQEGLVEVTGKLQELIMSGTVPPILAKEITSAVGSLAPSASFAVRSSALAEDSELSFAGQYSSELAVAPTNVAAAYQLVLAGKYCPRALAYRLRYGLSDSETAMAALVVPMLAPRVSGVVYSRDPAPSAEGVSLGVYAVAGLAAGLVDGSQTPEKYHLSRSTNHIYSCEQEGSAGELLSQEELLQIKQVGLQLEERFGYPLDLEWAIDDTGLTILQCRRLHQPADPPPVAVEAIDLDRLLYHDLHCAAPGIACGPVVSAAIGKDFTTIPTGSVVITTTLRPSLSLFLDRIAGVVAEHGSRASHFAAVARERGVPVVIGNGIRLKNNQLVTVDGVSGRIFHGCIDSILRKLKDQRPSDFPSAKFRSIAAITTQLNLIDSTSNDFALENCTSLHDVVRFCHEMAVREMFAIDSDQSRRLGRAQRILTDLPLTIYLVDLDSHQRRPMPEITPNSLASAPMRAFWQGLADQRIEWDTNLHHVDWEQFDRISGGIFSVKDSLLASYALVAANYLHLDIRFGYHFSVVDAFCSDQTSLNYVNFRFKGGGAALKRRGFRLTFIERILTACGFETSRHGDMLDGAFSRAPAADTECALTRLGLLLAATRMMDMRLASDGQAEVEAKRFREKFGIDRK